MSSEVTRVPVWDPFIRIFHWSLVFLVFSNLFLTEEGDDLHEWFGYAALGLVILRVIWGGIGPFNARFINFYPNKDRILTHLKEINSGNIDPKSGHNPLGGVMVISLMTIIVCLGVTGYMLEEVDLFFGSEWLEELHEVLAEALQIMIFVHVAAVIIMQRFTGLSLIKPMITGKRDLD